jgi:hypothetical protein
MINNLIEHIPAKHIGWLDVESASTIHQWLLKLHWDNVGLRLQWNESMMPFKTITLSTGIDIEDLSYEIGTLNAFSDRRCLIFYSSTKPPISINSQYLTENLDLLNWIDYPFYIFAQGLKGALEDVKFKSIAEIDIRNRIIGKI